MHSTMTARIIWLFLLITLIVAAATSGQPLVILSSAALGWFGGIAFVYAWVVKKV